MKPYVVVTGGNIKSYIKHYTVIVASIRPSRSRAVQLAAWELFFLLAPIKGLFIANGPLGEIGGKISFFVHNSYLGGLKDILKNAGYTKNFYSLEFNPHGLQGKQEFVWKGEKFIVNSFFTQDKDLFEKSAPHNREFYILGADGTDEKVIGYRGDGSEKGRRGLSVEDSRLMINLTSPQEGDVLLDPFAGAGGILISGRYISTKTRLLSSDIDPVVSPGLSRLSDKHWVADSAKLVIDSEINQIATEVPFVNTATESVAKGLEHLAGYLSYNGKLSLMCGEEQSAVLFDTLKKLRLNKIFAYPVQRQGSVVFVSLWYKDYLEARSLGDISKGIGGL